jgi:hypothetical protein
MNLLHSRLVPDTKDQLPGMIQVTSASQMHCTGSEFMLRLAIVLIFPSPLKEDLPPQQVWGLFGMQKTLEEGDQRKMSVQNTG